MLTEDMKRVVREHRLGFVATVCADGTPNLSPKGTTIVWDDEHLAFADIRSPRTIENLRSNSAVELNLVDVFKRKGYRFKGTAEVLTEGPLFERIMDHYRKAVERADERIRSVVLVRVERALELTSPIYDLGLSEEQVTEQWERYWEALREGARPERGRG